MLINEYMKHSNIHTCASCGYTQPEFYFLETETICKCPVCKSELVNPINDIITADINSNDLPCWFIEALVISAMEYPTSNQELTQLIGFNLSKMLCRESTNIILDIDLFVSKGLINPVPEGKFDTLMLDIPPTLNLGARYKGFEFEISKLTYAYLPQACFEHYKTKEHLGHVCFPMFAFPQKLDSMWQSIQILGTSYVILFEWNGGMLNSNSNKISWAILASVGGEYHSNLLEITNDEFQNLGWVIEKMYPTITKMMLKDAKFKRRFGLIGNMKFLSDSVQINMGSKIDMYELYKEVKIKSLGCK